MRRIGFLFVVWLGIPVTASEVAHPVQHCDRFLSQTEQKICEEKITQIQPDWYLAATCGKQDDDAFFFKCLEMTKLGDFSPRKLELCGNDNLSDQDRLNCIQAARANRKEAFQQPTVSGKTAKSRKASGGRLPAATLKKSESP